MKNDDNWIIQLRKGIFELAILSLINKKPMYGYEITNALKQTSIFRIPNGTIYPILSRITKKSWAISYWEESKDGPQRKYYLITKEGYEILESRFNDFEAMYEALNNLKKGREK